MGGKDIDRENEGEERKGDCRKLVVYGAKEESSKARLLLVDKFLRRGGTLFEKKTNEHRHPVSYHERENTTRACLL